MNTERSTLVPGLYQTREDGVRTQKLQKVQAKCNKRSSSSNSRQDERGKRGERQVHRLFLSCLLSYVVFHSVLAEIQGAF